MPKTKKQPHFVTRFFHGIVGFLALSSALRSVAGNNEEKTPLSHLPMNEDGKNINDSLDRVQQILSTKHEVGDSFDVAGLNIRFVNPGSLGDAMSLDSLGIIQNEQNSDNQEFQNIPSVSELSVQEKECWGEMEAKLDKVAEEYWKEIDAKLDKHGENLSIDHLIRIGTYLMKMSEQYKNQALERAVRVFKIALKNFPQEAYMHNYGEYVSVSYNPSVKNRVNEANFYLKVMIMAKNWLVDSDRSPFTSPLKKGNHITARFFEGTSTSDEMFAEYFMNAGVQYYHEEELAKIKDKEGFDSFSSMNSLSLAKSNMIHFKNLILSYSDPEESIRFMKLMDKAEELFRMFYHLKSHPKPRQVNFSIRAANFVWGEWVLRAHIKKIEESFHLLQEKRDFGKIDLEEFKKEEWMLKKTENEFHESVFRGLLVSVLSLLSSILFIPNAVQKYSAWNRKDNQKDLAKDACGSGAVITAKQKRGEEKRKKQDERKALEQASVDPVALAEQEQLRLKELQVYAEEQAKIREAREENEKIQALERKKIKEEQFKLDDAVKSVFNDVFTTLSSLTSSSGAVKNLFKGPNLRQLTLGNLLESGENYFIPNTVEIDQKRLAQYIVNKIKMPPEMKKEMLNQFAEIFEKGPDAIRVREALAAAEAARYAREEAVRLAEIARLDAEAAARAENVRMEMNKTLYTLEKEKEKGKARQVAASSSSSSSSSSSRPMIRFACKEDADKVNKLIAELTDLVKAYQSPENISNDLFELKHDLIKISAIIEQIVKGGGRTIVQALLNYSNLLVIRNGALHLLEIDAHENIQVKFYQDVLLQMGKITLLNIDEAVLSTGLNKLLETVQNSHVPVDFHAQTLHEMYQSFHADSLVWMDDHEKKFRSDVFDDIASRKQLLAETPSGNTKRVTMLCAEIGELYNQLKITGAEIPQFAHRLIAAKNEFAHEGKAIEVNQFKVALKN